ncbi:hypothetical protein CF065_12910 [Clostridium sporogenes]
MHYQHLYNLLFRTPCLSLHFIFILLKYFSNIILLQKILNFELQPKYRLQPEFKKSGKTYRVITYVPYFLIYHFNTTEELIDVKGMITQQGEMRNKIFDYNYPGLKLDVWRKYDVGK